MSPRGPMRVHLNFDNLPVWRRIVGLSCLATCVLLVRMAVSEETIISS
jgi:hypothetical protein